MVDYGSPTQQELSTGSSGPLTMSHGKVLRSKSSTRAAPYDDAKDDEEQHSIFGVLAPPPPASSSTGQLGAAVGEGGPDGTKDVVFEDAEVQPPKGGRGKGGKTGKGGRGKGGGGGKGYRGQKGGHTTADGIIQTHAKALLQLDLAHRQKEKEVQWVLILPQGNALAEDLDTASTQWKKNRPSSGPHPSGAIHEHLWRIFTGAVLEQIKNVAVEKRSKALKNLEQLLENSRVSDQAHRPSGKTTFIDIFRPVQAKRPADANWIWVLKPNMALNDGRDMQGNLSYWNEEFSKLLHPLALKRDRMPQSGVFRAVEAQLKAMSIREDW